MKTKTRNRFSNHAGFTLVEMMVSSACAVILFGGMLVTMVAQQRGFIAALYQMDSQADESRVLAYLSRDLRNATSVQISAQGTQVTLTIPTSTASPTLNLNLGLPLLSLLSPPTTSGTATETISYYRQGTAIVRQVGTVATQLSTSATQFQIALNGSMVSTTLQFQPTFSIATDVQAATATQVTSSVYLLNSSQL
ncbi:MAG: prepilin-type N-terminal cleavage/methylation domain-containing protein [Chthoniobacteraceae bacterium]